MNLNPAITSMDSVAINPMQYDGEKASVTKEIRYINNLGVDVVVLDRRGVEFKIPSRFNNNSRLLDFKIIENYQFIEGVVVNFSENEEDEDIVKYRQNLLDSLQMDSKAQRTTRKAIVETSFKKTDLNMHNNAVYIKEHDIVVYVPRIGITVIHPTTVSLILNGLTLQNRNTNDFNFSIKINDPRNMIGNRYLNISGVVYEIVPSRDPAQIEGVVVSSTNAEGELCHVPMSLEEFEKNIKSYRSYEEAELLGNLEEKAKQELTKELELLKHNNAAEAEKLKASSLQHQAEADRAKQELASSQTELKNLEAKHKKEMELLNSQLDREKSQMEWQSLQRKNYYEERSYDRKDTSELIKFLPMVIGAGLVLLFK